VKETTSYYIHCSLKTVKRIIMPEIFNICRGLSHTNHHFMFVPILLSYYNLNDHDYGIYTVDLCSLQTRV
jgi:hypothetical protein